MKIEDFARYVDAIAPTDTDAGTAYDSLEPAPDHRRSRLPVLATVSGLAAAAIVAVVVIGLSTATNQSAQVDTDPGGPAPPSTIESTTSRPTTSAADPTGGLTVGAPGGPTLTIVLADDVAVDPSELLVTHQVGFTIGSYGYDATIYDAVTTPFDPCPAAQPCTEVAEPVTNAAGLVIRSWAPTLVPGAEPTAPTTLTVEALGGDAVLAIPANFAGAPVGAQELASSLSYDAGADGPGTFTATVQGQPHELTWITTMVQPKAPEAGAEWILNIAPDCEGADRCESAVGLISLTPTTGERLPIDRLVESVTVDPPR